MRRFGLMAAMIGSLLIFAIPASGATLGKKVSGNTEVLTIGHRGTHQNTHYPPTTSR